jgi:hypothetical protein
MKSKTIVAVIATLIAFTYLSCKWFEKDQTSSNNKISFIGEWQVVNYADSSKDSSKNPIGQMALSIAMEDSLHFKFNEDSTAYIFTSKQSPDTSTYSFHESDQSLLVYGKDKDSALLHVDLINKDSLHLYMMKDSILYILKKIK